jgi:hypothetical protein
MIRYNGSVGRKVALALGNRESLRKGKKGRKEGKERREGKKGRKEGKGRREPRSKRASGN